jgi:glycolate oxidase FAD binding subunit
LEPSPGPIVVDSVQVDHIVRPVTVEEMAAWLGDAPGPVAFVGGGTELEAGNPLGRVDAVIRTDGLDRITEYVPADLTIHVEGGVRVGALMDVIGDRRQLLPLDPWNGPDATIGGIVATNAQGPLRTVGTVRDWIIGMTVVHADGRVSKTGGRVVKNVSGYDVAKLYTGSLGSLAAIAEVSFKLRAAWEATASARLVVGDLDGAARIVREIRMGPVEPVSLVWSGPEHAIAVRFGEHPDAVRWQMAALPAGDWEHVDGDAERALWDAVRVHYHALPEPVVRVVARPTEVAGLIREFAPAAWVAHAALGTVLMSLPPAGPGFAARLGSLRSRFPAVVERAPVADRREVGVFGVSGVEYDIMRRMKTTFDPAGRLNPGRHIDGESPFPGGNDAGPGVE